MKYMMHDSNRLTNLVPVIDSSRALEKKKKKEYIKTYKRKKEEAYLWIYNQFKFPSERGETELEIRNLARNTMLENRFDEIQRKSR